MSNTLDNFWRIDEVSIPFEVELSVYREVNFGGCRWPNSMSVTRMGNVHFMVMNMPPVLNSAAEAMIFLIVRHVILIGALCMKLSCLFGSLLSMNHDMAWYRFLERTR